MNKKGVVKIIEASLAITIIIGVIFFIFVQNQPEKVKPNYDSFERNLLKEISENSSLRQSVLNNKNLDDLRRFFDSRIPLGAFAYDFRICGVDEACGLENYIEGNVFAQERVISADIGFDSYSPKKIRLFIWRK